MGNILSSSKSKKSSKDEDEIDTELPDVSGIVSDSGGSGNNCPACPVCPAASACNCPTCPECDYSNYIAKDNKTAIKEKAKEYGMQDSCPTCPEPDYSGYIAKTDSAGIKAKAKELGMIEKTECDYSEGTVGSKGYIKAGKCAQNGYILKTDSDRLINAANEAKNQAEVKNNKIASEKDAEISRLKEEAKNEKNTLNSKITSLEQQLKTAKDDLSKQQTAMISSLKGSIGGLADYLFAKFKIKVKGNYITASLSTTTDSNQAAIFTTDAYGHLILPNGQTIGARYKSRCDDDDSIGNEVVEAVAINYTTVNGCSNKNNLWFSKQEQQTNRWTLEGNTLRATGTAGIARLSTVNLGWQKGDLTLNRGGGTITIEKVGEKFTPSINTNTDSQPSVSPSVIAKILLLLIVSFCFLVMYFHTKITSVISSPQHANNISQLH